MRILALVLVLVASPAFAQDSPLVGNWKLVAFQNILDNDPTEGHVRREAERCTHPHARGAHGRNHHGRKPQSRHQRR